MGTPKRTIEARRLFEFAEIIGDRHLIQATVGPDLDPVLLTLEREPDDRAGDERDENAHIHDASGRHLRSFHAGDSGPRADCLLLEGEVHRVGRHEEEIVGTADVGTVQWQRSIAGRVGRDESRPFASPEGPARDGGPGRCA